MNRIKRSLKDLLGPEYVRAVCEAQAYLTGKKFHDLLNTAEEEVEFTPAKTLERWDALLDHIGEQSCACLKSSNPGCGTTAFARSSNSDAAPLAAYGPIRIGENGHNWFIGKSEHYHASLGHQFPGYRLLEIAKKIGITNVTHNNTRGHITRLLEQELVRIANGLTKGDNDGLSQVIASREPHVLNRVINLETGSLAVEAALKMMLMRFYRLDNTFPLPRHAGKTPVFIVMGDHDGGCQANYHGTTILTQCLRGMWPELTVSLEKCGLLKVCPARINDIEYFQKLVEEYNHGQYRIAGFFHELVLMNYGGIKLDQDYVTETHRICREHEIPVMIDEIQSCMWSPELFLFKEYRCKPDFVSVGKGFPGGEYPASKILAVAKFDHLNQFGALVTNGQEELASLAYLVTMEFAEANGEHTRMVGEYYHHELRKLAMEFPRHLDCVEGEAHMTTLFFKSAETAMDFSKYLTSQYHIDVSTQTYKANCPPAVLTKLPLISTVKTVNVIIDKMRKTLNVISKE